MGDDWYSQGKARLVLNGTEETGVTVDDFTAVYSFLVESGLIDYDVEKEIFYDLVHDDEDED